MTEADLDYVMSIEGAAAQERFVWEWSRAQHEQALKAPGRLHLVIESVSDGQAVGFILLAAIDSADKSIEFQRIVVRPQGQGYGRHAIRLLKRYVFDNIGARRLWLDVKEFNERARMLYRSEGFVEERRLSVDSADSEGSESLIVMAILDREYELSRAT